MLYFFGYVKSSADPENTTGFFEYDAATDAEQAQNYKGHVRITNSVIDWVADMTPEMLAEFQY